jgi:hypothetical protein
MAQTGSYASTTFVQSDIFSAKIRQKTKVKQVKKRMLLF